MPTAAAAGAIASGVAGAAAGALDSGPKTTTRKNKVPAFAQRANKQVVDLARENLEEPPPGSLPEPLDLGPALQPSLEAPEGPTQPPQVPNLTVETPSNLQQGFNSQASMASGLPSDLGEGATELGRRTLEGEFLRPESNPALQANIDAAQQDVLEDFERNILPQITSGAVQAGQVGSSRQGVAQGIAADQATEELGNIASRMIAENFARERQLQQQAPQLIQQGVGLQTLPGNILQDVGSRELELERQRRQRALQGAQAEIGLEQSQLGADQSRINLEAARRNLPLDLQQRQFELQSAAEGIPLELQSRGLQLQQQRRQEPPLEVTRAQQIADILGTLPLTQTQKVTRPGQSPLVGAIKGGLGGASLGGSIGSQFFGGGA